MILPGLKLVGVIGSAVAVAAVEPVTPFAEPTTVLTVLDHYASTINTALLIVLYFITVKNRDAIKQVVEDNVGEVLSHDTITDPQGGTRHIVTKVIPEKRRKRDRK